MVRMSEDELRGLIEANAAGMHLGFAEMRQGFAEMRQQFTDIRRHFDVVAESFDTKVDFLVEGLMNLDEKMVRKIGGVREDMRQGFADTHDLIKFSYNLTRRKR